ncbi:MAG: peroxiredoxin [Saprospiraceae bacterium]
MAKNQSLAIGDALPAIRLKNQDNEFVQLEDYKGTPMVVYFYPKNNTSGCTAEACSFRDQFEDFKDTGALVFGISADSPTSHKAFQKKHRLPFTLLSDKGNVVRKQLGIKSNLLGLLPGRVTFVIDKSGVVQHTFSSQFDAKKHVKEALKVIQSM